jgi:fibronectin-binding autotransporter adhesin
VEIKTGGAKINSNGFDIGTGVGLSGPGALMKQGAGTFTLGAVATHGGGTSIQMGTLARTGAGALTGPGAIDIAAGAFLSSPGGLSLLMGQSLTGKGTVTAPTTIVASGTLAPGNSIGTLSFSGDLTMSSASISNFEIIRLTIADADLASAMGVVTYGGTLNVTSLGGTFVKGDVFNLFDGSSFSGSFSSVNLPALTGTDYWRNDLSSNGTITFIPEPSSLLLGVVSLAGLVMGRRRRK